MTQRKVALGFYRKPSIPFCRDWQMHLVTAGSVRGRPPSCCPALPRTAHVQCPGLRFLCVSIGASVSRCCREPALWFQLSSLYRSGKSLAPGWVPSNQLLCSLRPPQAPVGRATLYAAVHRPACLIRFPYISFLSFTKGLKQADEDLMWCSPFRDESQAET